MSASLTTTYPRIKTTQCAGCGCLIEVRYDSYKMSLEKAFCGRPCMPSRKRKYQPITLRVFKHSERPDSAEYERALRKHKGLEVN